MSASMQSPVLEVRDLVKTFNVDGSPVNAIDHVSFQVNAGEFVAVVGPSGSGKTTLLSILAALLAPTSGDVFIDGHELSKMGERQRVALRRSRIGFTFQSNNLIPYLTARENVEFMLRLNGLSRRNGHARPDDLLRRLGLGDRLRSLPAQLSGGEQQRVAIARALIHEPALVLADEPTAALDTQRAFQVVETFAGLIHEQNRTGIMVTHDLRMCKYVDRVLQMQDGRLVREYTAGPEIEALAGAVH
jgi:putative ABC transport system ATP-binding protein